MEEENLKEIKAYIKTYETKSSRIILSYLDEFTYKKNPIYQSDPNVFFKILSFILDNDADFNFHIYKALDLYKHIVKNESEFEKKIFLKYFKSSFNFNIRYYDINYIYDLFDDKRLGLSILEYIIKNNIRAQLIFDFKKENYCNDYEMFSSLIKFFNDNKSISCLVKEDSLVSDITDIDKLTSNVKNIKNKTELLESTLNKYSDILNNLYKVLYEKSDTLDKLSVDGTTNIKNIILQIDRIISRTKSGIDSNIEISYKKLNILIEKVIELVNRPNINTNKTVKKLNPIDEYILDLNSSLGTSEYGVSGNTELIDSFFKSELLNHDLFKLFLDEPSHSIKRNLNKVYYYALYNDNLELLKKLSQKTEICNLDLILFKKDISSKFDIDEYTNLIINKEYMLREFIKEDEVDLLIRLLKINPNFELKYSLEFLKLVLEHFSINDIAQNKESLDKSLDKIYSSNSGYITAYLNYDTCSFELEILREVYDINSNFCLYVHSFSEMLNYFSISEISKLTQVQQKRFSELVDTFNKNEKTKEIFRKLVLANNEMCYIGYRMTGMFEDNAIYITVDEYLKLDYKTQMMICKKYQDLRNTQTFFRTLGKQNELNSYIKKIRR
ncbi:MAG: hypothetical protein IJ134_04900 [Bacilli bacterium]|nr:hypothetical protein [Bacilli bacterium]